jgi:hypothetical protein
MITRTGPVALIPLKAVDGLSDLVCAESPAAASIKAQPRMICVFIVFVFFKFVCFCFPCGMCFVLLPAFVLLPVPLQQDFMDGLPGLDCRQAVHGWRNAQVYAILFSHLAGVPPAQLRKNYSSLFAF